MSATLRLGLKDVANQTTNSDRKISITKTPTAKLSREHHKIATLLAEGTQTHHLDFDTNDAACQTEVSCLEDLGPVTSADLTDDEPSQAYWRAYCDSLEEQLDRELETSITLSGRLLDKTNELSEMEEELRILDEAIKETSDDAFKDEDGVINNELASSSD